MKTETIYICPICNNGTLKDDGESIDSGECSACGESSYYSEAIASKKDVINLKEVAKKILEKQPYRIIKDEKTMEPATEKSQFVDVLTFSVCRVGENFRNLPYAYEEFNFVSKKKDIALIGSDGEIIETIKCSAYSSMKQSDELQKQRKEFKFSSNENTLVFALKLTEDNSRTGVHNYLMFLSKPMTIKEMQEKRDSYYFGENQKRLEKGLQEIELIWK